MGGWLAEIAAVAHSVVLAVLPLAVLFVLFQVFLLKLPRTQVRNVLIGTLIATVGLFLFLLGVAIGFLPFGRAAGAALGAAGNGGLFVLAGFALGFLTTLSEPAVRILAQQVESASNGSIRGNLVLYTICIGVAVWVALGALRIIYEIPLLYLLVPGYGCVIVLLWLAEGAFVGIAADASGVATGPLVNSFLLALALGASSAMDGQNPVLHGFGLVALIALAPLMSVMLLGVYVRRKTSRKELPK